MPCLSFPVVLNLVCLLQGKGSFSSDRVHHSWGNFRILKCSLGLANSTPAYVGVGKPMLSENSGGCWIGAPSRTDGTILLRILFHGAKLVYATLVLPAETALFTLEAATLKVLS